jgi:hypothetical protein
MHMTQLRIVAFFPGEGRALGRGRAKAARNRELRPHQKFLLFEAGRLRAFRQCMAGRAFGHLGAGAAALKSHLHSFWTRSSPSASFLQQFAARTTDLDQDFRKVLESAPTEVLLQQHAAFLANCMGDFEGAIAQAVAARQVAPPVDSAFRCMVRAYPAYVRRGLVDRRGNFLRSEKEPCITAGSEARPSADENEEALAADVLTQGRAALALHHALRRRRTLSVACAVPAALAVNAALIAAAAVARPCLASALQPRRRSMDQLRALSDFRFTLGLNQVLVLVLAGEREGFCRECPAIAQFRGEDPPGAGLLAEGVPLARQIAANTRRAKALSVELLSAVAVLGAAAFRLEEVPTLFRPDLNFTVCDTATAAPTEPAASNFLTIAAQTVHSQTVFARALDRPRWFEDSRLCDLQTNFDALKEIGDSIALELASFQERRGRALADLLLRVLAAVVAVSLPLCIGSKISLRLRSCGENVDFEL